MKRIFANAMMMALGACIALTLAVASEVRDSLDNPDVRWRRGPVRFLLEKTEANAYKKLKTKADRQSHITEFWKRRDPTPGTEENEFKNMFADRLELVMKRFGPPRGRGWEDDRGMAVSLLGPPDKVEMTQLGGAGGAAAGGAGQRFKALLTFESEPYPGAPSPLVLQFRTDSTGAFKMIGKFDFSQPILTGLEPLPFKIAKVEVPPEPEPPPPPPEPEPEPPAPPTPGQELLDALLSESPPEATVPISARLDFYKTKDADTFATVTIAVDVEGIEDDLLVAARFIKEGMEGDEESFISLDAEDSFSPAEENDYGGIRSLVFQAGHNLEPGAYSLAAAIKDPSTGKVGLIRQKLDSPDFRSEEFQLSTVTLARIVEPLTTAPSEEGERFILGSFKVLPSADAQFSAGEDVCLYFQIYNTSSDPASGKPSMRVTYKFEKIEESGNRLLGGKPIASKSSSTVQAYALPISESWPAGEYQVQVKVEDLVAKATAGTIIPFTIVK
jgi:GWxTD domain-containing protein